MFTTETPETAGAGMWSKDAGCLGLQQEREQLRKCAKAWQIEFNMDKRKMMLNPGPRT